MTIKTVGELMDELALYSRATPLVLLLRAPLDPASETILAPMRVSARRESGVDIICREVVSQRMPVFREHSTGVNADRWDSGGIVETAQPTADFRKPKKRGKRIGDLLSDLEDLKL